MAKLRSTVLRWLGSKNHQYVTQKQYDTLNDKLDSLLAYYDIKLVKNQVYDIEAAKSLGFKGRD
jgi:hypothetical protein